MCLAYILYIYVLVVYLEVLMQVLTVGVGIVSGSLVCSWDSFSSYALLCPALI